MIRAAARGGRLQAHQALEQTTPPTNSVGETELRAAIVVIIRRQYSEATRGNWPEISRTVGKLLEVDVRRVLDVLEKIEDGKLSPEDRRPGAGRKPRISPGSEKADRLVGGLLAGFGTKNAANFVN